MWTNLDLITGPYDDAEITPADFAHYHHPREVVADPQLSIARKRAILSRWLSDACAVPDRAGIRVSPLGVAATVQDLRTALEKLDEMVEAIALAELANRPSA